MSTPQHILMVAGEPSGDLHGAGVIRELKRIHSSLHVFGIGGEKMRAAGQEQLYTTRQMAMVGFTEVLKHLPFVFNVLRHLEKEVRRRKPGCAVLIDYPGFNLRLAKRLKALGIPILYYIAPQVWAWGAKRIPKMAKMIDHMAVVFPFEAELFRRYGLPTTFVGHPLLEQIKPECSAREFYQTHRLHRQEKILTLLPGSRRQEIEALLPDMLKTATILARSISDLRLFLARSPDISDAHYDTILAQFPHCRVTSLRNQTYSLMRYSHACLVASGTATLETACFATPMVIVYRVSRLTYAIGRRVVRLPYIGLANIVAGEKVVPEYIQNAFEPERVANELFRLLTDADYSNRIRQKLQQVRRKLGEPGASQRVAKLIVETLCAGKV